MDNITNNHLHVIGNIKKAVNQRIDKQNPQVIVVSKQRSLEDISKLYDLGYRHFGENRVDELLQKQKQLPNDIVWHFIGTLQTRKVKKVINDIHYFHALDRYSVIDEIEKRAHQIVKCFLQINLFNEPQKHGFLVEQIDDVLNYVSNLTHVHIVGFMVMAPFDEKESIIKNGFDYAKQLQVQYQLKHIKNCTCQYLSMGMSQDFELAIQSGATHLRIGSIFFRK